MDKLSKNYQDLCLLTGKRIQANKMKSRVWKESEYVSGIPDPFKEEAEYWEKAYELLTEKV